MAAPTETELAGRIGEMVNRMLLARELLLAERRAEAMTEATAVEYKVTRLLEEALYIGTCGKGA